MVVGVGAAGSTQRVLHTVNRSLPEEIPSRPGHSFLIRLNTGGPGFCTLFAICRDCDYRFFEAVNPTGLDGLAIGCIAAGH